MFKMLKFRDFRKIFANARVLRDFVIDSSNSYMEIIR